MQASKTLKTLNIIARWFVGLVFLFSSFVKAVDPIGTAYKMQDYMNAWSGSFLSFEWALPFAPFLTVVLITCEFLVAVMLLTGSFRRFSAWLLAAMMLFFTFTSAVDAFSPTYGIDDCGCFGDAVKLTPLQTFLKNIVLDIPTLFIFFTNGLFGKRRFERNAIICGVAIIAVVVFQIININNEPCIDFRPWKVGNEMMSTDDNAKAESFMVYKNLSDGSEKEFSAAELSDAYVADSAFDQHWEWVNTRVVDPNEIRAAGFSMLDQTSNDLATEIIRSYDTTLILTVHHLEDLNDRGLAAIQTAYQYASQHNWQMVMLSAATVEESQDFLASHNIEIEPFFADATAIEAMLRSNPGFLIIKDAKVINKCHYRNIEKMLR